ncbi:predicted GPI-anchored protein 23 [Setaria italica]|uniref:predicted GPI-anchored protein 23 n=1 Tax=Setaria italica TaxID=4555 RepID=UPI00064565C0|nr:predicted GPI-anchored protein 23 [Setaria italica]
MRAREDSPARPNAATPIVAAGADAAISAAAAVSATAAVSAVATRASATISAAAIVFVVAAEAGATVSTTAAVSTAVAATSVTNALDADAFPTGSSSASSSRFITSPNGGTLGTVPCPAGSAAGAEGGIGVGQGSVPDCGTLSIAAAAEAASAGGTTASPMTPPLAPGGAMVGPAEAVDTRSAFFDASGGTKSRGAALPDNDNFIKSSSMLRKE